MDLSTFNRDELTLLGTGACTMLALHFSSQLASQHLYYWKNPKEQRAIMIIILMAPFYAVNSFVAVLDVSKPFSMLLETIKGCYEALVIAKFLELLYGYLNISISNDVVPDEIKGREIFHSFPMTLFQSRTTRLNQQTLKLLKYWVWQFVVTRPTCAFLKIGLQLLGVGSYSNWVNWTLTIILSISMYVAMYSLVVFYHVFAKELKPYKPIAKLSCIIGIVFFCFWQGVLLHILVTTGVIKSHHFWTDVEHVGEAIQNVMICVEMIGFSVFQQYAFHFERYSGDVQTMLRKGKKNE